MLTEATSEASPGHKEKKGQERESDMLLIFKHTSCKCTVFVCVCVPRKGRDDVPIKQDWRLKGQEV